MRASYEEGLIQDLCQEAYACAVKHGFHGSPVCPRAMYFPRNDGDDKENQYRAHLLLAKLMLISTELAEAAEEVRKGTYEGFTEELADACIRLFDLAGSMGMDLETAILEKMDKNDARPYMHGGKRA